MFYYLQIIVKHNLLFYLLYKNVKITMSFIKKIMVKSSTPDNASIAHLVTKYKMCSSLLQPLPKSISHTLPMIIWDSLVNKKTA